MNTNRRFKIVSFLRKHWLLEVVVVAFIGIVMTSGWNVITDFLTRDNDEEKVISKEFTSQKPTLIGIYPSDAYGIDQKKGLEKSLERYAGDFDIVHLDFLSLNLMKEGRIQPYLDSLNRTIKNKNVFSIIGPSVTESSVSILKALDTHENKPPIFLLTAASKNTLEWDKNQKSIPMYRICTDIDLRSQKISGLLEQFVSKKRKIGLLVEKNKLSNSYGEQFLETIEIAFAKSKFQKSINEGLINISWFEREDLNKSKANYQDLFDDNDIVLFLGIGGDFKKFLDTYYLTNQNPKAFFGGWLTSYAFNQELTEGKYNSRKIFEITDFDITTNSFANLPENIEFFKTTGRTISPPERDFALGFDAGFLVSRAYEKLTAKEKKYLLFNKYSIGNFVTNINTANGLNVWHGVTGEIRFAPNGENSRDIQYVQYRNDDWYTINSINQFQSEEKLP